jgi:large subunit ribosomal protein L1
MRSKQYQSIKTKAPTEAVDITSAVAFIKENARKGFDETVEVHVNLNINSSKSDQMVRGSISLPAGSPKKQKIVVFTEDSTQQKDSLAGGAAQSGGEELINEIIKNKSLDADITIATPDMMPKVAKAAKILGPKGLMPNPKTGTVSPEPIKVVKELLSGKASFKMDQLGNVHQPIAKVSWDEEKIVSNAEAFLQALNSARPDSAKGELIRNISIKSTMSPAISIKL